MRLSQVAAVVIALSSAVVLGADDDAKVAAALEAVKKWAPLMDSGQYETCWNELAQHAQIQMPEKQWLVYMAGVRKPMGELKSRKQLKAEYISSLKGIPDQEGALIQFDSSFEKQSGVIETFGVIHEKDGPWRVGYYLTK